MADKFLLASLLLLLLACTTTSTKITSPEPVLQNDLQKSSYAQGVQYMQNLQQYDIPLAQDQFLMGINDALNKKAIRLTPEQLEKGQFWVVLQQANYNDKIGAENLTKGKAFLRANKQKPGVISLPSGLQYKVLAEGMGKRKPTLKDTASVRYRISRINGDELAKSGEDPKAQPDVQVSNVIKGWQEALLLMPVGSKWQLYIPSELAYGAAGAPEGKLEPNETLIFDVELVGIKAAKPLVEGVAALPPNSYPAQVELVK